MDGIVIKLLSAVIGISGRNGFWTVNICNVLSPGFHVTNNQNLIKGDKGRNK